MCYDHPGLGDKGCRLRKEKKDSLPMDLKGLRQPRSSVLLLLLLFIHRWMLKLYVLPNPFNLHCPIQQPLDVY